MRLAAVYESALVKTKSVFIQYTSDVVFQTRVCLPTVHMLVNVCVSIPPIKTVLKPSNPSEYSIGYVPINKLSQAAINMIDPLINS